VFLVANVQAYFGLREAQGTGASPTYEQQTQVNGILYNQGAIYYGDIVGRLSSSNGQLRQQPNGITTPTAGVFKGCKYLSTSQKRTLWSNYWPGSDVTSANQTVTEAYYDNSPYSQWLIQCDASTNNVDSTAGISQLCIGANCDWQPGTGSTSTGISGGYLPENSTAVTITLPLQIRSFTTTSFPPGANGTLAGSYAYVLVGWNNIETKATSVVLPA
jgi:hypothetical protein